MGVWAGLPRFVRGCSAAVSWATCGTAFELPGVTASGRNLGAGCVSSETGARNECEGGAMKTAKEKARGLVAPLPRTCFPVTDAVEPT